MQGYCSEVMGSPKQHVKKAPAFSPCEPYSLFSKIFKLKMFFFRTPFFVNTARKGKGVCKTQVLENVHAVCVHRWTPCVEKYALLQNHGLFLTQSSMAL